MKHRLFVYGTLQRGCYNHRVLMQGEIAFLREATTVPAFSMTAASPRGGYPFVQRGGNTAIKGELFEVDDVSLAACDLLEGHPTFYRRELVELSDGEKVISYLLSPAYPTSTLTRIDSGDWKAWKVRAEEG